MNIAVLGATGMAGSRIVDEALRRGHRVTGVAPQDGAAKTGMEMVMGDVGDLALAERLKGCDTVIRAMKFADATADRVIAFAKAAGAPRLLSVGGAGTLEVAPGKLLMDTPDFPEEAKSEAAAGKRFLDALRAEEALDWTFICPAADFRPGARTGHYRVSGDQLLTDAAGNSHISAEDFAIAVVDELETPSHPRARFSVAA